MIFNKHVLVVYIFYDELMVVLVVNPTDDGLDGRIALNKNTFRVRECQ